jgi:hypothetical protein
MTCTSRRAIRPVFDDLEGRPPNTWFRIGLLRRGFPMGESIEF